MNEKFLISFESMKIQSSNQQENQGTTLYWVHFVRNNAAVSHFLGRIEIFAFTEDSIITYNKEANTFHKMAIDFTTLNCYEDYRRLTEFADEN